MLQPLMSLRLANPLNLVVVSNMTIKFIRYLFLLAACFSWSCSNAPLSISDIIDDSKSFPKGSSLVKGKVYVEFETELIYPCEIESPDIASILERKRFVMLKLDSFPEKKGSEQLAEYMKNLEKFRMVNNKCVVLDARVSEQTWEGDGKPWPVLVDPKIVEVAE